jgi:hypothetical protein
MKKLFLTLVFIEYMSISITHAQIKQMSIGINAGPSLVLIYGSELMKIGHSEPSFGYSIGLSFDLNIKTTFAIKTGITFERKGQIIPNCTLTDKNGQELGYGNVTENNYYLDIPLMISKSFGNKVIFFINIGAYGGFLVKSDVMLKKPKKIKVDNTDGIRKIDIGFILGLGVSIPLGQKFGLSFELRDNLGIASLYVDGPFIGNHTIKNNVTTILVGFAYKILRNKH